METEKKRTHTISSRVNVDELALIDRMRTQLGMRRGEFLRQASLKNLPPIVPEINKEVWLNLARVTANLNQYQRAINEGRANCYSPELLPELREMVEQLRRELLGQGQK